MTCEKFIDDNATSKSACAAANNLLHSASQTMHFNCLPTVSTTQKSLGSVTASKRRRRRKDEKSTSHTFYGSKILMELKWK
jgi:hypothetical protein